MSSASHGVDHYENFPVASWLTPARLRPAIAAIYWFARVADDIADEGDAPMHKRLDDLAAYRADLMACARTSTSVRWPQVFGPLAHAMRQYALPLHLFDDLLQAFEQDVHYTAQAKWYDSNQELMDYCRRSANPIGRLLLHLYGVKGEAALQASDAICSSLQLVNFWQDLSRDIPLKRFYLPRDAMAACAVTTHHVLAQTDTPDTIKLVAHCTYFMRDTMKKGVPLPRLIVQQLKSFDGWRLSLELRCMMEGGLRIAEKMELVLGYRTLSQRPKLGIWDGVVIFWRALTL